MVMLEWHQNELGTAMTSTGLSFEQVKVCDAQADTKHATIVPISMCFLGVEKQQRNGSKWKCGGISSITEEINNTLAALFEALW